MIGKAQQTAQTLVRFTGILLSVSMDARTFIYFVCLWGGTSFNVGEEDKERKRQIGV